MRYSTLLVTMAAAAGMVNAHIGMFHPSALDFYGDGYDVVTPLANRQFKDWWFHGKLDTASKVTETFALPAGSSVTVELSCRKEFTSYGRSRNNDPCPLDTPSIHAATPVDTGRLLGCGLAIAYKSDFHEVRPNDFTIFSVNHDCVRTTSTEFQVPKDMPECPSGGCICAWFWQGQNSADEMYMTGSAVVSRAAPRPPASLLPNPPFSATRDRAPAVFRVPSIPCTGRIPIPTSTLMASTSISPPTT